MSILRPGDHPDELISAAVSGDLTDQEQARLDAHLGTCERCRQTLADWTEQRRLVSQMHGAPVPRDLAPRIRAGIESGAFAVPWWRRTGLLVGVGASLATVAAAVVAVLVIGDLLPGPEVASTSSPLATATSVGSPQPSSSASVEETPAPSPSGPVAADERIPPYYLAYSGPIDNQALTVRRGDDGGTLRELPTPSGQPVSAALSPDGKWLAYITPVGLKGTNMYWVANLEDGAHVELGESSAIGSPFTNSLFWSSDSRYLTFTLSDRDGGPGTDAWLFDSTTKAVSQLTDRGDVVAAGWRVGYANRFTVSFAWVTVVSADPTSYELPDLLLDDLTPRPLPIDPTDSNVKMPGVFQPVWNDDGSAAIFWRGTLNVSADAGYEFVEGGAPYLARNATRYPRHAFDAATPLFSDVSIGRDAFASAAVTWGANGSDAYAVWNARWTGVPQSATDGSPYPDETRIYFSHLSDERNILAGHALDAADLPDGAEVTSVSIAPLDTDYLAITIGFPAAGDLDTPEAKVLVIKRNTGDVPDELVRTLKGPQKGWFGPAVYPQ
jgi:hypothetical protein